jgi:ribosomal protein S24E
MAKPKSDLHKKAISDAHKGKKHPHKKETKHKIAESLSNDYELTSPFGLKFYVSSKQLKTLIKFYKLKYSSLMAVKDKQKKYKGWSLRCLGLTKNRPKKKGVDHF